MCRWRALDSSQTTTSQWSFVWGPEVRHWEYLLGSVRQESQRVCRKTGAWKVCIPADEWNPWTEEENPQLFTGGASIGLGIWRDASCSRDPAMGGGAVGRGRFRMWPSVFLAQIVLGCHVHG